MTWLSSVVWVVVAYVIYKLIDRLLRLPRVGRYSDRYIFVTGCDTGFGNLLAKRLDHLGCHVFAGCLTEKGETELRKNCSSRLHTVPLDVTKRESVQKAADYVKKNLPQGRGLWGIVNNAGVISASGPIDWLNVDAMKRVHEVNLWGVVEVTLTFLPLVKREKGRVVNTASVAGRTVWTQFTTYCMSKYGVEAFTDGLRRILHDFGCKAILIEPGSFKTPLTSRESIAKSYKDAWEMATPEVKAEYGQEYSDYLITNVPKLMSELASDRATDVVDAYQEALFCRYPRPRYLVGNDAKYLYIPIQQLPEWLGDWIFRKMRNFPLPAAVRNQRISG